MEHENKSLTLEQLRESGRDPVYLEVLDPKRTFIQSSGWCRIEMMDVGTDDEQANIWWPGNEVNDIAFPENYGEVWLAYAHKPINFDAWKPCEKCRSCFSCTHVVENAKDSRNACFWCDHMDKFEPLPHCSKCGRPLTAEAREMLDRRLRG
ncbi:hypothetical protein B5G28_08540 [Faecalibacterium sp. An77]|uniref:hypothetical protein n=1 Tax=Faecalibacterium sp. An77 TaxID=1965655 RepID=UPI000B3793D9|nr:hypothetical protein [Faecalibacterium sp. An77]OUN38631.1 hypothetical protein B5G28_08540 [Faecalibacterium sp. An77]